MKVSRKILISMLTTLVGFIIIKMLLPQFDCEKIKTDKFWLQKTFDTKKYDIIICGDSRTYRGVSTEIIINETENNLTAKNLGYSSVGFSNDYFDFVLSKLNVKSQNKFLIIGVTPSSFLNSSMLNEHLNSFKNKTQFEYLKGTTFSSFNCFFSPIKPLELIYKDSKNLMENMHNGGWVETKSIINDTNEAITSYQLLFSNEKINDINVSNFIEKLKKLSDQGIQIIMFYPPTTYKVKEIEDSLSGFNRKKFISKTEDFVHWLDLSYNQFNTYDGSHLNIESAEYLSQQLGKEILLYIE